MAKGDKKNGVNDWEVIGVDKLGRPKFGKKIRPKHRSRYKDTAKRALDPMRDVGEKPNREKLDDLPHEFSAVFFGSGGRWDDASKDGNTLYGTHDSTGKKVVMSRQGNEIIIAVDNQVKSVIGPAEERELKFRYAEMELGGEELDRKRIADINVSKHPKTGDAIIEMETVSGAKLTYEVDRESGSATGYITVEDEDGRVSTREIAQNIPIEDIAELSNQISEEDGKGSPIATIGQAVIIGKYMKRQWRKYANRPKETMPRMPFSGALSRFFEKGLKPLDGF